MHTSSDTIELTELNFDAEVLRSDRPVLVDFWAEWCGPCRVVGPVVDQLAREFSGRVKVGKVNVEEQGMLAQHFGIRAIPTLLVFREGRIVDQIVGALPREALARKLEAAAAA